MSKSQVLYAGSTGHGLIRAVEWATFTMDNNVLGVNDGSTLKNRTFAAVRGTGTTYTLALYDGMSRYRWNRRISLTKRQESATRQRHLFP